mmetsp:Transcript_39730/g.63749  ORF Transcript_39730/g.63749 Transcript_39730/m.63749 type:complete len:538 (+) Transcript_39730:234-1847(+)
MISAILFTVLAFTSSCEAALTRPSAAARPIPASPSASIKMLRRSKPSLRHLLSPRVKSETFDERSAPLAFKRNFFSNKSSDEMAAATASLDAVMDDIKDMSSDMGASKKKGPSISSIFATVTGALSTSILAPWVLPHAIAEICVTGSAVTIFTASSAAEFKGKEATAEAKEIACVALAKAARAEILLSRAEKARSVIPLMVGISASAATFCLIFPQLIHNGVDVNPLFISACPIIATAAAALGAAASVETLAQGLLALGERGPDRILSVREATNQQLRREVAMQRIVPISKSVLPAIIAGLLLPSAFVNKCIISSAISAVAAAYSFAEAEAVCGECLVKVANIAKASAKAEVLANDAKSQSAVLPFTSAVAGLALAGSAIVCEFNMAVAGWIPLVGAIAAGLSNQAAAKSRQDAADARLAFLDEKLKKMAKTDEIPDLALKVMPPLLVNMGVAGGRILLNSIQDGLDPEKKDRRTTLPATATGGASTSTQSSYTAGSSQPANLEAVSINVETESRDMEESATAVPPRKSKAERFLGV